MKVLSLGASKEQIYSIQLAKKLGLQVIACDMNPNVEGKGVCDKFYNIDIKDKEKIINVAKKHDIKMVLPAPIGRYLTTIGAVNDALQLKGISENSAEKCVDKYLFNIYLRDKIKLANQFLVNNYQDIKNLLKQEKIELPFILKPRFGSGSRGVYVIEYLEHSFLESYFKEYGEKEIILESFIEGDEIGVDGLIINKRVKIISIRDKIIGDLPYRQELQYKLPSKHINKLEYIYNILSKVVETLKVNYSLFHADMIINNKGIFLIEFAPRPAGNYVSSLIIPASTGINIIKLFIEFILFKKEIAFVDFNKTKPVIFEFINFRKSDIGKTIKNIDFESIDKLKTIIDFNIGLKVKDIIKEIRTGRDAFDAGYFLLKGEEKEMEKDRKEFYANFKIENIDKMNKEAWIRIIKKNILIYPDTNIVSFLARNFPDKKENSFKKAIDIGFGSGRHMKLLSDFGFQVYGVDYVKECCQIADELFGFKENVVCGDFFKDILFHDIKFHVIVAWGVLFNKPMNEIQKDMKTLYNYLVSDGKVIMNFRTKKDSLYGQGEKIDDNTFILNKGSYKNICYSFFDQCQVEELIKSTGLKIINVSRVDFYKNLKEVHSWWIIEAMK